MEPDPWQQSQRDISEIRTQLRDVRLTVLRLIAAPGLTLVALGVCLPAFSGTVAGEQHTYRILTAGIQFLSASEDGDGRSPTTGIGFLGLLIVLLVYTTMVGVEILSNREIVAPDRLRNTTAGLSIAGTVVALGLSFVGVVSDADEASGGWGALVTLLGLLATVAVTRSSAWHDLGVYPTNHRHHGPRG